MRKTKRLLDGYRFSDFHPAIKIKRKFGDPKARIITLRRRQKKQDVVVAAIQIEVIMITKHDLFVIYHVGVCGFIWMRRYGVLRIRAEITSLFYAQL